MGNPYKILLSILLSILIKLHGKSHAKSGDSMAMPQPLGAAAYYPLSRLGPRPEPSLQTLWYIFFVWDHEKKQFNSKKVITHKKNNNTVCLHKIWKSMSSDIIIYSVESSNRVTCGPAQFLRSHQTGGSRNRTTGWVVFNGVFVGTYWSPFTHGPMLAQERVMTSRLGLIGCPKIMWCFINIVRQPQLIANTPIKSLYPIYPQANLA